MKRSFGLIALLILVGALIGHLIGKALPWPIFSQTTDLGFAPVDIDLLVLHVNFGFRLSVNLAAGIGMAVAAFLTLRR